MGTKGKEWAINRPKFENKYREEDTILKNKNYKEPQEWNNHETAVCILMMLDTFSLALMQ